MAEVQPTTASTSTPPAGDTPPAGSAVTVLTGTSSDSATVLDWHSQLPPDLRDDPTLKPYQDIVALAKGHIETKRMVGGMVKLPGEKAPPEEWGKFFDRLGRPENATKYSEAITLPDLPEGMQWDQPFLKELYEEAYTHGVLPQQLTPVLAAYGRWLGNQQNLGLAKRDQDYQGTMEELGKRWGASTQRRLGMAQAALRRFTDAERGPQLWEYLKETGLGNHPDLIEMFANVGELLPEDTAVWSDTGASSTTLSGIQQQIAALVPEVFKLSQQGGQAYTDANTRLQRLYQQQADLQQQLERGRLVAR